MAKDHNKSKLRNGDALAAVGNGQNGWALGPASASKRLGGTSGLETYKFKGIKRTTGIGNVERLNGESRVNFKWGSCETSPG